MTGGKSTSIGPDSALSFLAWANLRSWHREYGRHHLPWRRDATPWNVLLAEVLLHRTRASAAERIYDNALNQFPGPEAIVRRTSDWLEATRPAGLAWRSRIFVSTCERLVVVHQGEVPSRWNDLTSLPGVGHYIASSVRCFGFGLPEVLVDTNTIRLASRVTGKSLIPSRHRSKKARKVVAKLYEDGSSGYANDNYAFLDLAALVCHIAKPACSRCPLLSGCDTGSRLQSCSASAGLDDGH